ncbi:hypothetical protein BGZ82_000842 [Podila clonocystis]|nr:hypothetical protein BGZ82_000842 [Podila clonocystis]
MALPQDIPADILDTVEREYVKQPQLCQRVVAKLADKTGQPPTLIRSIYKALNAADRLAHLDGGQKRSKSGGFSRAGTYASYDLKTFPDNCIKWTSPTSYLRSLRMPRMMQPVFPSAAEKMQPDSYGDPCVIIVNKPVQPHLMTTTSIEHWENSRPKGMRQDETEDAEDSYERPDTGGRSFQ